MDAATNLALVHAGVPVGAERAPGVDLNYLLWKRTLRVSTMMVAPGLIRHELPR